MGVSGFLREVAALKKIDVAQAERTTPLTRIRQEAEGILNINSPIYRKPFLFLEALERSKAGNVGIIAEIKKTSPSKGDIKPDLDPAKYAEEYTKAGACAISVLTETHYFKGSLDDLKAVRAATDLPILRKDFTLSSYQIYEAKAAGADSILLIAAMLSKEQLRDYVSLARELKIEPLVEINSEWELDKALFSNARTIGINNRNLETLKVDLNVSKRVVPFFIDGQIPVEASGISSPDDIQKGLDSKIFNFLVGESIVRAENTKEFIQSLVKTGIDSQSSTDNNLIKNYNKNNIQKYFIEHDFSNDKKVFVKICGLTTSDEALACVKAGADAIGFIFYPKSPRYIMPDKAADITKKLPDHVVTTGVFVDEDYKAIMHAVKASSIKAVQLHGNETPELVRQLARQGLIVIKALFAGREPHISKASLYEHAHAILVEYGKGVLPGGNAESWNWKITADMLAGSSKSRKIIIAGGINPENIKNALETANPWGVDLSSGVEISFGKKDIEKVERLISEIKK